MAEEIKVEVKAEVQEPAAEVKAENAGRKPKKDFKKDGRRRDDRRKDENDKVLVSLRRVTKVVKGGRTFRFSAMVVVGDKKGKIGIAIGKAKEVPMAIEKAGNIARRHMQSYQITNGTIEHEVIGKYGKSTITLLPAKPGTGIIAGGAARAVFELAGYTDITAKIHGSTNKINTVRATLNALKNMRTAEQIAMLRGKSVEEL